MKILNYTPHNINLVDSEGNTIVTYESNGISRVSVSQKLIGNVNGFDLYETVYGEVEGLPQEEEGTFYIVSSIVLANSDRNDLIVSNDYLRDKDGRIIGCKSFTK